MSMFVKGSIEEAIAALSGPIAEGGMFPRADRVVFEGGAAHILDKEGRVIALMPESHYWRLVKANREKGVSNEGQ